MKKVSYDHFITIFFPVNSYGDMPAHNLLWRECDKTSDNVAARLAAIPLVQVFFLYLLSSYLNVAAYLFGSSLSKTIYFL